MSAQTYDCTRCGACCLNPSENVAEGFTEYVEIERHDVIRQRHDLLRRFSVESNGRLHLRLLSDQRCIALAGSLGHKVRCTIYHARPSPCRRVEAGSELCQRYRRDRGVAQATLLTLRRRR